MWTGILIFLTALLFFVPSLFEALPEMVLMAVMGTLLAAFFFISLFVWSEQAYDEREELEQLQMNKWAFIMWGVTIIIMIIYQSFTGGVDPALPIILVIMLGTKLLMKNYYRLKGNGYIK
jgi:cobalamin synthase